MCEMKENSDCLVCLSYQKNVEYSGGIQDFPNGGGCPGYGHVFTESVN